MTKRPFDEARAGRFLGAVMEHHAGAMAVLLSGLGDRLGLFAALADGEPTTAAQLAERASIGERYALEWLRGMHAAGYLDRDEDGERYRLPREHRPVLIKEGHPFFQGYFPEQISGLYPAFETVVEAMRTDAGVEQSAYSPHFFAGLDRASRIWAERSLVDQWIAQLPAVRARLESGIDVAELGCGSGRAAVQLAQSFPASRIVGYDLDEAQLARATAHAEAAGVADRVTFERRDLSEGLDGSFDLLLTFDVLHDVPDPLRLLQAARGLLRPDASLLLGEWAVEDDPDASWNPLAAFMYGFSVMYCVPTTLAQGGPARGTLGLPESEIRALADAAGFADVALLATMNPVLRVYHLTL